MVKNKLATPFREAQFDIMYGEGISYTGELVDMGVEYNLIKKSGAWYSMGDIRLGQGRENAKIYFKEHPEETEELNKKIMEVVAKQQQENFSKRKSKKTVRAEINEDGEEEEISEEEFDGEDSEELQNDFQPEEAAAMAAPAPKAKKRGSASKAVSIEADDFDDDLDM